MTRISKRYICQFCNRTKLVQNLIRKITYDVKERHYVTEYRCRFGKCLELQTAPNPPT